MSTPRRGKGPIKKARKSAALILAEADIKGLKDDVASIKRLIWGIAGGIGSLVVTVLGYGLNHLFTYLGRVSS